METLVSASDVRADRLSYALFRIHQLCRAPRSVAEIAAELHIPLGVAQVLIADGVEAGLLQVHLSGLTAQDRPSLELMQRVLRGLHQL